jgi:hypothetical protein
VHVLLGGKGGGAPPSGRSAETTETILNDFMGWGYRAWIGGEEEEEEEGNLHWALGVRVYVESGLGFAILGLHLAFM